MSDQVAIVSRQPATRLCSPGSSPAIRLQRSGGDTGWWGEADREGGDRLLVERQADREGTDWRRRQNGGKEGAAQRRSKETVGGVRGY